MRLEDTSTVALGDYLYRGDAEVARALLASEGIAAYVKAEDEGGLNPGFFSEYRVVLMVNAEEAATARSVLGLGGILLLPEEVESAMVQHSQWAQPNEACGLIAGSNDEVKQVFCLTNRATSPVRYTIDPREHFGALRYAESLGWSIIGAWHSHPAGDAELSRTDLTMSPGGPWITVVVGSIAGGAGAIRAYRTSRHTVIELAVHIEPAGPRSGLL